jgi:carbonic anhydrase
MATRRSFLAGTSLWVAGASFVRAEDLCAVSTKATQAATSADQALKLLKEGNERFLEGKSIHCDLMSQVKATAGAQAPFAAILGCMDSRVPPELVFDQRIGDIFSVRVAGNIVNTDILGSLEYATQVAGTKLIVVGGGDHTSKDKKFVQKVADQNARDSAADLIARSEVMAALVKDHKLKIVSAMHDVSTGAVRWLT